MNKTKLQELAKLLNATVVARVLTGSEWEKEGGEKHPEAGDAVTTENGCLMIARIAGSELHCLEIGAALTPLEKQLLGWAIRQGNIRPLSAASDLERQARSSGNGFSNRCPPENGEPKCPIEWSFATDCSMGMVLSCCPASKWKTRNRHTASWRKPIRTYIPDDTLLIPLREHEWLVLTSDSVLSEAEADGDEEIGHEEMKELLASLGARPS